MRGTAAGGIGAMSEPRIGRLLVASLHQSIQDVLPNRLDFYENWLSASGLREGTIGLAPLSAVLSFLRLEGEAYNATTTLAGQYAAEWAVAGLPKLEHRIAMALPRRWRARSAMRVARDLITATYPGTRTAVKVRSGRASVYLRGSLFCEVREASSLPLCGFYAAAIARVLLHFAVPADVQVTECRAAGAHGGCLLGVMFQTPAAAQAAAADRHREL
jgi:hypothetical protein